MTVKEIMVSVGDVVIMNGYLEVISDLSVGVQDDIHWVSAGGGFLHNWPGEEAYVDALTAGTREPAYIIAVLGHLEQDEFIDVFVRGWGHLASQEILVENYAKPPQLILANIDEEITPDNFRDYLLEL